MSLNARLNDRWANSSKPRLPDEVKNMIIETFQDLEDSKDLPWLWIGGRHVSRYFRSEIERIFRTVFLPETVLRCHLGLRLLCWDIYMSSMNEKYAGCHTEKSSVMGYDHELPCFTLDRFSDDQTRAFFKYEDGQFPSEIIYRRLHEKHLVGSPVFSIQVRDVVNDTGLPELQIDDDKEEISFEWMGMLDRLMGEEHIFNTILSQRLGWHFELETEYPDILDTHRKLARRSRLQRECRAKYSSNILDHYTTDEASAIQTLDTLRFDVSSSNHAHDEEDTAYTKKKIANELRDGTTIFNGNPNPGLKIGSIPRGIFTDKDYCMPENRWGALPPPSAVDLFSPRPLPQLSWGRRPMYKTWKPKRIQNTGHGRRVLEQDKEKEKEGAVVAKKRRGAVSHC